MKTSPRCLLGSLLSRQGSSLPDGALILAVRELRSVSAIFRDTSADVPTLSWEVLVMVSSPDILKSFISIIYLALNAVDKPLTFILVGGESMSATHGHFLTSDLGSEGAARNVLVVKFDNDVVVSWSCGQVGHNTGAVFVVFTSDLSF